jgi:aspartate racemase
MKHIGILAHSYEGATLCFREMCAEGVRRLGPHHHPEITLTCTAMAHSLDAWGRGDHAELRSMFMTDAEKLVAAGADFFCCPDNSAHIALESPGEPFPIPALHIAEVVADQAAWDGRHKVGILGTNWTMTGPVYPGALGRRGIAWAAPGEPDRKIVHDIIMDELCLGTFRDASRAAYVAIINKFAAEGCDCVALVCTEIPLLITSDVSPLPILDSTRLLARAAVAVALGEWAMPEWRGGPLDPAADADWKLHHRL